MTGLELLFIIMALKQIDDQLIVLKLMSKAKMEEKAEEKEVL